MFRLLPFLIVLTLSSSWVSTAVADEEQSAALPYSELQSVIAFDQLMGKLQELRKAILTDARSEREAAEGMRFILRTLAMSQDVTGDGYAPAPHFTGKQSTYGQCVVPNQFRLKAKGRLFLKEFTITGVVGTSLVSLSMDNLADESLYIPSTLHELDCEPVKEFRMSR